MPTEYPLREAEFDLGGGHSFDWLTDRGGERVVGLVEHHPKPADAPAGDRYCGGYAYWEAEALRPDRPPSRVPGHRLVVGGPGDERRLTVEPSLVCRSCDSHGSIRDGRWVDA